MKRNMVSTCEVISALAAAISPEGGTVSTASQMKLARTDVTTIEGDSSEGSEEERTERRVHSMRR